MNEANMPWYKQVWPWILISIPASSVIAGSVLLWLATNSQHAMVVDDYYKYGKSINKRIERDMAAARLGLVGTVQRKDNLMSVAMASVGPRDLQWPALLNLKAVHPSDADQDKVVELVHRGSGNYGAPTGIPAGRWQIHLEPPSGNWRLVSDQSAYFGDQPLRIVHRVGLISASAESAKQ